jgi:hypothetical protein
VIRTHPGKGTLPMPTQAGKLERGKEENKKGRKKQILTRLSQGADRLKESLNELFTMKERKTD